MTNRPYGRSLYACAATAVVMLAAAPVAFGQFGSTTLRKGAHGHDVRVLQSWLDKLGYTTSIDGAFGTGTQRSVRRFEEKEHLKVDGIVDPKEANLLRKRMQAVIEAANQITNTSYRYGGGHGSFDDSAYDCSGAVSHALHGASLVKRPLDSTDFESWGARGRGKWITVYANSGHAYMVVAGLRFDTSGSGEKGPRWRKQLRSSSGYVARHPSGL